MGGPRAQPMRSSKPLVSSLSPMGKVTSYQVLTFL